MEKLNKPERKKAKFNSLEDFKEGIVLVEGEMICFKNNIGQEFFYVVENNRLNDSDNCADSGKIFKVLNIKDEIGFCEKYYRYLPKNKKAPFPTCEKGDYEALTRVTKALMELSEQKA